MTDRSIGELFSELARETTTLVRQEILLAKLELGQKASKAGKHVGLIAAGGAVAFGGLLAVIAAIILLLAEHMSPWLAALLVGVAVIAGGYALIKQQLEQLKGLDAKPTATLATLREDKQWAKEQLQ